ncbi:response regulator transcription factor [Scleromatobacter humisilvae]|uniref:Response regulator transcription factor n=1 Tax=Scleromatobacter humisilvae TaxID=2897159 RepID=A0A9X1YP65_9BURK|nr:response regulator transcription factor [Scleromatobacter humisilvae]MCK9689457.1 response regulator transcription factor [Scleromatobacter humisilvae]
MDQVPLRGSNVLVKHGEPLLALGMAAALRQQPDLDVRMDRVEASDSPHDYADVILTDYLDGLNLAAGQRCPKAVALRHPKILVVTSNEREQEVRMAMEHGVHGYLLLSSPVDELVAGVRTLLAGSRYICIPVARRMADSLVRERLTARESEVLELLVDGRCNKSIANQLGIAIGTVKHHVKAVMGKLEASSRTHAVSIASERGLVGAAETRRFRTSARSPRDAQALPT